MKNKPSMLLAGVATLIVAGAAVALLLTPIPPARPVVNVNRSFLDAVELALIILTAVVAAANIATPTPTRLQKWGLFFATGAVCVLAIAKATSDTRDKELLQDLSISNLYLPNDRIALVKEALNTVFPAPHGAFYRVGDSCWQWGIGLSCYLEGAGVLVLNRYDVSSTYAKLKRGETQEALEKIRLLKEKAYAVAPAPIVPKSIASEPPKKELAHDEDFMERLGILAFLAYFEVCGRAPQYYTFHRDIGVGVETPNKGPRLLLTKARINQFDGSDALAAFSRLKGDITGELKAEKSEDGTTIRCTQP